MLTRMADTTAQSWVRDKPVMCVLKFASEIA